METTKVIPPNEVEASLIQPRFNCFTGQPLGSPDAGYPEVNFGAPRSFSEYSGQPVGAEGITLTRAFQTGEKVLFVSKSEVAGIQAQDPEWKVKPPFVRPPETAPISPSDLPKPFGTVPGAPSTL